MRELMMIGLGFLKIIYEFVVPAMIIMLGIATITIIKQDKYWLRKIFNKYIVEGEK